MTRLLPCLSLFSVLIQSTQKSNKYFSESSEQPSKIISQLLQPSHASLHHISLRFLKEQQDDPSMLFIIFFSMFASILFVCLIIYCIRSCLKKDKKKIRHLKETQQILIRPIQVLIFFKEVCRTPYQSCPICLGEFITDRSEDDRITEGFYKRKSKLERKKLRNNPNHQEKIMVKYPVCGHLIHTNCFDLWIQKQNNCPLCRQCFDEQNLKVWQQKIGLDINYLQEKYLRNKNSKKLNKQGIKRNKIIKLSQTIASLQNNEEEKDNRNDSLFVYTEQTQNTPITCYPLEIANTIAVCRKIAIYHKHLNQPND